MTLFPANSYINLATKYTSTKLGDFDMNGRFTFSDSMTALVVATISGQSSGTSRAWIKLQGVSSGYVYDSCISYGTYNTCVICKTIIVRKGEDIGLRTTEAFHLNSGGFMSTMDIIRLY